MMQILRSAAINAAELRLVQSKRNLHQSMDRTRSNLRAAIARPSTLAIVALASGVSAFLLSHRARTSVKSVPKGADFSIGAFIRGLLRTFVSVYGARVLTLALQLGSAAPKQSGSGANANMPGG